MPFQIGRYRILEEIGHGGMGVVYKAEQREPVRRLVALKVVQAGIGTKEVLARFQLERRALAAMSHRCIAKVLDAGATDKGEPFFVMELVEGLPLTYYCDKHRLSLNDRLKLFQQVCDGVQHAHLKGVVHRDLKPGNVLVVREGEQAVPKILDFGLAKATNRDFLDATLFTEKDRVLGTPEYMSPEQAAGDGEGVDARADIYSLGVMLYELLCGELPFPTAMLRKAGALEALRLIREQEPAKPSAKLTSRPDSQALAEQRRTSLAVLRRALAGDLDWIALKAMAKEPERRYDAATALAADVGRYLEHLPVLAGPPSFGYRLKKFVQRYRVQVIAAAAVLVALLAGGIGTALGFAQASARAAENERLAKDKGTLADQNGKLAEDFAGKVREFDQLAGAVLYDRAVAHEKLLYPAWPQQIEAMERWLREDAGSLLALRPDIAKTVRDLEARALPATAEQIEADRRSNPQFSQTEQKLGEMTAAIQTRRTFIFSLQSQQFLHDTLVELLRKLESFSEKENAAVKQRLQWAHKVQGLSLDHPNARHSWSEVREAIAKADDVVASKLYSGQGIELRDQDVIGLVPIGMNPVTKLWEFYDLRSAWNGRADPAEIAMPELDNTGNVRVGYAGGIILVLIPGGTVDTLEPDWFKSFPAAFVQDYRMGLVSGITSLLDVGAVVSVRMPPVMVSKYEMTQLQWLRLRNMCAIPLTDHELGCSADIVVSSTYNDYFRASLPATRVSWELAAAVLSNNGMQLPSELLWTYACSTIVDPMGHDRGRKANVDSNRLLPVGFSTPNRHGLYDCVGNAWELCGDFHDFPWSYSDLDHPEIPLVAPSPTAVNFLRGGSAETPVAIAALAQFVSFAPSGRSGIVGIRPMRVIVRRGR